MTDALIIRPLLPADADACDAIVRDLPDWFGLDVGIRDCAAAVRSQDGLVAERFDGSVAGFLTWVRHFPETAEISWMAVAPDDHRRGVGRALLGELSARLVDGGARLLLVKTLSANGDSEDYDGPARSTWRWSFRSGDAGPRDAENPFAAGHASAAEAPCRPAAGPGVSPSSGGGAASRPTRARTSSARPSRTAAGSPDAA
jgi:GNAT superfamily N-acetyltransferase